MAKLLSGTVDLHSVDVGHPNVLLQHHIPVYCHVTSCGGLPGQRMLTREVRCDVLATLFGPALISAAVVEGAVGRDAVSFRGLVRLVVATVGHRVEEVAVHAVLALRKVLALASGNLIALARAILLRALAEVGAVHPELPAEYAGEVVALLLEWVLAEVLRRRIHIVHELCNYNGRDRSA